MKGAVIETELKCQRNIDKIACIIKINFPDKQYTQFVGILLFSKIIATEYSSTLTIIRKYKLKKHHSNAETLILKFLDQASTYLSENENMKLKILISKHFRLLQKIQYNTTLSH